MDKKVKYVGSAVAAALMVAGAPVIVPMLEPTQNVYADGETVSDTSLEGMLNAFKNQFDDRYIASTNTLVKALTGLSSSGSKLSFNEDNPVSIGTMQNDSSLKALRDADKSLPDNFFDDNNDVSGYITITGAGSTDPEKTATSADLATLTSNIGAGKVAMPIKVTIHLEGTNPDTSLALQGLDPGLTTFSFTINSSRIDITQDKAIPSVFVGSSLSTSALTSDTNKLLVTDNYSNKLDDQADMSRTPIYGKSLFRDKQKAMDYAKEDTFDPNSSNSGDATDALDTDGKITKADTYYQTISYQLDNDGKDKAIENMLSGDVDKLSGTTIEPYPTYINSKIEATDGTDYVLNKKAKMITIVRPFTVSESASPSLDTDLLVNVGSSTDDPILNNSKNDKLMDSFNNTIQVDKIDLGNTYYTDSDAKNVSSDVTDGKFNKSGLYYRKVTFYLANGNVKDINFGGKYTKNLNDNSVTYIQTVTVNDDANESIKDLGVTIGDNELSTEEKEENRSTLTNKYGSLINTNDGQIISEGKFLGYDLGTKYYNYDPEYYNSDSAVNSAYSSALDKEVLDGNGTATDGVIDTNGNFAKAGDYLRTVTFYLNEGVVDTNSFGTDGTSYKLGKDDKGNDTVTYVQKVHIAPAPMIETTVTFDNPSVYVNTDITDDALSKTDDRSKYNIVTTGNDSKSVLKGMIRPVRGKTVFYTDDTLKNVSEDALSTPGTYYRELVFYIDKSVDVSKLSFDKTPYKVTVGTGDKISESSTVSFVQKVTVNKDSVNVNANAVPDLYLNFGVESKDNLNLTTDSGATISSTPLKEDDVYYKSVENAEDTTGGINDPDETYNYEPGTYYRYVTFTLDDGLHASDYTFHDENGVSPIIGSNGTNDTVTYLRKIIVNKSPLVKAMLSDNISIPVFQKEVADQFLWLNDPGNGNGPTAYLGMYPNFDTSIVNTYEGADPSRSRTLTLLGHIYYDSAADALADGKPADGITYGNVGGSEVPEGEGTKYRSSRLMDGFAFTKVQTYYRKVSFRLELPASAYTINGDEGKDYILSDDKKTITFAQAIHVTGDSAIAHMPSEVTYDYKDYENGLIPSGASLEDSEGQTVGNGKALEKYYNSPDDINLSDSSLSKPVGAVEAGKSYYRVVELSVDSNLTSKKYDLHNNTNALINGYLPVVDSTGNSLYYIQRININPISKMQLAINIPEAKVDMGADMKQITTTNDDNTVKVTIGGEIYNQVTATDTEGNAKDAGIIFPADTDGNLNFYANPKDALEDDSSKAVNETTFTKDKNYYLPINFYAFDNNESVNYVWPGIEGTDYVFRTINLEGIALDVVTYVQKFKVVDNSVTATVPDINIPWGTDASTIDNDKSGITFVSNDTNESIVDSDKIQIIPGKDGAGVQYFTTNNYGKDLQFSPEVLYDFGDKREFTAPGTYYRLVGFVNAGNNSYKESTNGQAVYEIKNGNGTITGVLYAQKVNVIAHVATETPDTVSSSIGSSVSSAPVGNTTLTSNGDSIVDGTPEVGSEYFTTAKDAVNNTNVQGQKFTDSGLKYRRITFTIKNPNSNAATDLASYYTYNGVAGTDYTINGNTVTFAQPIYVGGSTVVHNISEESVQNGSLISDSEKSNNDLIIAVKSADGQSTSQSIVATNGVTYGTDYYAVSDNTPANILSNKGTATAGVTDGTNFTKTGDYYRVIKFKLNSNIDTSDYAFVDGVVSKDADGNSYVEYVQEVNVRANSILPIMPRIITNTGALTTSFDSTNGYDITSAGSSIVDTVEFGNFYDDAASAVAPENSTISSDIDQANHKFLKNKTYYRTVTFTLKSDAKNYDFSNLPKDSYTMSGNKITLAQKFYVESNPATANIFVAQGKLNGLVSDSEQDGNNALLDSNGKKVFDKISYGDTYYKNSDRTNPVTISQDGKFTKAGTYYRQITFHLISGALSTDSFKGQDVTVDGDNVSYTQEVDVNPSTTTVIVKHLYVNTGSSTTINDIDDDDIVDSSNNSLIDHTDNKGVTFDNVYYASATDALKGNGNDTSAVGSNFISAGNTYYRRITFKLKNDASNYSFTDLVNGVGYSYDKDNQTVTFIQAVTVNKGTVTSTISTLKDIVAGSSTSDVKETTNDQLLDQNGNSIVADKGIKIGTEYYDTYDEAIKAGDTGVKGSVSDGGIFTEPKTYYRTITFALKNPSTEYNFAGTPNKDYVLNADGTVSFVQSVTVTANDINDIIGTGTRDVGEIMPDNDSLGTKNDLTLNNGGDSIMTGVTFGDKYYTEKADAVNGTTSGQDKVYNAGTYYRAITFALKNPASLYKFDGKLGEDYVISEDGKSITFAQPITVGKASANPSVKDLDIVAKTSTEDPSVIQDSNNEYVLPGATFDHVGVVYYKTRDGAKNLDSADVVTTATTDGFFNEGNYYRLLYFTVDDDFFNNYEINDDNLKQLNKNTVVYAQPVNVSHSTAVASPEIVPGKAIVGNSNEDVQSGTNKLLDSNGNLITAEASFGSDYYDNSTDVFKDGAKKSAFVVNGKFTKVRSYFRKVIFQVTDAILDANSFGTDAHVDTVNKTVSYVQAVTVGQANANIIANKSVNTNAGDTTNSLASKFDLKDDAGNTIGTSATPETVVYYKSLDGALNQNASDTDSSAVSDGTFNEGSYYRLLVFTPNAGVTKDNYTLTNDNSRWSADGTKILFVQEIKASANAVSKYNVSTPKVTVGSSEEDSEKTDGNQIFDKSGNLITPTEITFGKDYYANSGDVFDTNAKAVDGAVVNGKFAEAETYYREIIFHLDHKDIVANSFGTNAHVDANANTVSYVQTVVVSPSQPKETVEHGFSSVSAKVGDTTKNISTTTGTLKDTSGKEISAIVTAGDKYYDNSADVFSGTAQPTVNGQFTKAKTYYREINFKLTNPEDAKNYNFGTEAHVSGDTVSFVQTVNVAENSGAIQITVGPLNIKTGTRTNDLSVTSNKGYVLNAGKDSFTDPILGISYYKNANGALDKSNGGDVDPNAVTAVTDGAFNKGTYYRQVIFKVGTDFVDKYGWSDSDFAIYKDGAVIYAQQINVSDSVVSKHTIEDAKANVGDQVNTITSTGDALMDASGNKLDATVSYGTDYYDNYDDVFASGAAKTADIVNGTFTKAKTYYRVISFTVSPEVIAQNDFGSEAHISGNTVSFVQAVSVDTKANLAVNINVAPITVSADTSTNDAKLTGTTGYTLNNKLGTVSATVSAGDKYYTDVQSALKQGDTGLADVNGQFTKAGTYYRIITFTPSTPISVDSISDPNAVVNADGTISYVQAVNVTKNDANINASVSELNLKVDANEDNPALINTKEYFLKDHAGNSLVDKTKGTYGVKLGQEFFTDSALTQKTTDASGARISKAGTYYRTVKFYLTAGANDANEFKNIGGTYDATDNSVTFVQTINATDFQSNLAIAKINNVTVDNGTDTADKALQNADDVYIVDSNGKSIIADGGINFDTTLYNSDGQPVTSLTKAGTYSQVITVKLIDGAASTYTFGKDYKVNQADNTVSYVRTVTVKPASSTGGNTGGNSGSTGGTTGGNTGSSTGTGSGTDVDDDWNYSDIKGVVTTKSNNPYYALNNQDNEKIPNRVLGKDSSWKVDQVRVNKAGVTEYRVATGEWIYADDVILNQNNAEDGDWTYTPVQGVVTTKTDQKQYQLNNHENEAIANRNLKENSSWKTDLYRTNKEGVKQYRVATGEWVDAVNVDFNQAKADFWTYTSVSGVVKTKDGQTEYQLNNQENKAIARRELNENTSWKTDLYRTNEAGVRQYRVATGEWIDANDVNFVNNSNTNDEGWIYTSVSGIVTTKSKQASYPLENQENNEIAKRDLIKDSSWKTDQYRTNRAGVKQYRVATGEWIDANDVVYEQAVDTGIFRDGRKVSGIINLDRTNILYTLYSRENEVIEDYSLGEETSWKTDYKAQDVNGDTYYHVGDNEWIKAEKGVHFNNYAWY